VTYVTTKESGQELDVSEVTEQPHEGGLLLGRRNVLGIIVAAGVITPLIGTGTALAAGNNAASGSSGTDQVDDWYPIPEESGSVPWW